MKRLFTALFALTLVASLATMAQARQWPPGKGDASCSDTLMVGAFKVAQTQNSGLGNCFMATGDTVNGVGGIVTAFDNGATGYSFYIQNNSNLGPGGTQAPWTGVDIFTAGTCMANGLGLQLGDSVVVYGKTAEFSGGTEVLSNNASSSVPNIVIRKVSSGNHVPDFHVGTANELRYLTTNPSGEQWEGCLVHVNGPLRVVRTSVTGGMPFRSFMAVDTTTCGVGAAGPCDSLLVDGGTSAEFVPPATGAIVDFVQGYYDQRTSPSGYRVFLRDGNDIQVASAPNPVDAYMVAPDTIRIVFDRPVTVASAQNVANYQTVNLDAVVSATLEPSGFAVNIAVSSPLSIGADDGVSVQNLVSAQNGIIMPAQSATLPFYHGIIPIGDDEGVSVLSVFARLRSPDPAFLTGSPCVDRSVYAGAGGSTTSAGAAGKPLTIRGVVTAQYGNIFYLTDPPRARPPVGAPAARSGVALFAPIAFPLINGHTYLIAGALQNFFGEMELTFNNYLRHEGVSPRAAAPQDDYRINVKDMADSTCDVAQALNNGWDWAGVLVKVNRVKCVTHVASSGISFRVAASSPSSLGGHPMWKDTINVTLSSGIVWSFQADTNQCLSITGILRWDRNFFRIAPRSNADIVSCGSFGAGIDSTTDVPPTITPVELSFAVTPNPGRTHMLKFALPKAGDVQIGVYDLAGREVATVFKGHKDAGVYSLTWDGRDAKGGLTGAGMYFYRLQFGDQILTQRAIRLN
jgi:hypothetical protein